jgi:hypothetical protein
MLKKILICFLLISSSNAFAKINCEKGDFVTPPVWEEGFLTSVMEGSCTIESAGDLAKVNDYFIEMMTEGPMIQELHGVNEKASFEGLSAVEIDSTYKLIGGGELVARGLTHVGALDNGGVFFNRETKEIISATSWKKYTRKVQTNYKVTALNKGFKLVIKQVILSEMQEMAASFAKKGLKRSFKGTLKTVAGEVLDNL